MNNVYSLEAGNLFLVFPQNTGLQVRKRRQPKNNVLNMTYINGTWQYIQ